MKNERHEKILELINEQAIDRQEELLRLLHLEGFIITQATVSRDIRELQLVKTSTSDGRYQYVSANNKEAPRHAPSRFETIFKEAVIKIDYAGNIVMVKCFSGMANAACEVFDSKVWNDIVGTLSGDDTFIILAKSETAAKNTSMQLKQFYQKNNSSI